MRLRTGPASCGTIGFALLAWMGLPGAAVARQSLPPPDQPEASAVSQRADSARYQLRPGDVLDLEFRFAPEFNQSIAIAPDGYVSLRGVGDIQAGKLTLPELKRRLESAYASFMREPVIDVVLKDFDRPYFIVGGEVNEPGKYELRSPTTIVSAVAVAGGFTGAAKHSRVWLFRANDGGFIEGQEFNVKEMLKRGKLDDDQALQPGDMLFVPTSAFPKIEKYFIIPTISVFLRFPYYFWW